MDENKVRTTAYFIWESEGRPSGRDQEHWVKAMEMCGCCNNKTSKSTSSTKMSSSMTSSTSTTSNKKTTGKKK